MNTLDLAAVPLPSLKPLIQLEATSKTQSGTGIKYNFHRGQWKAWTSRKRIVCILAGSRAGKTSFGPIWLHREMLRKGPGDYLVAAPVFPLIDKAAGPEIDRYFRQTLRLVRPKMASWQFVVTPQGEQSLASMQGSHRGWAKGDSNSRILFGHADEPESLEAMTAKAAWLDEAGQKKFKMSSWEAIQRRLAIDQGRVLLTTTPYSLGWLKRLIFDPWEAAKRNHPEIDVIQFASTMNPAFPVEEYERARASLPGWKFRQFYQGIFEKPAGQIYDCFDPKLHVVPRFAIPKHWPRYLGLDFGGVNTAGIFFAAEMNARPEVTGRLFAYREYHPREKKTAAAHGAALLKDEPCIPYCVGGSKSEDQWRDEFAAGGLPVSSPDFSDVEVGIDRVYGAIKRGEIMVFSDLDEYLEELGTYSRVLDDAGEPTEEIDEKSSFHLADAQRYILGYLKDPAWATDLRIGGGGSDEFSRMPAGIFGKWGEEE